MKTFFLTVLLYVVKKAKTVAEKNDLKKYNEDCQMSRIDIKGVTAEENMIVV